MPGLWRRRAVALVFVLSVGVVMEDRLFDPGSSVAGAVWGFDVSTRRVALAVQREAGDGVSVGLLSLEQGASHFRLKRAVQELVPWLGAQPAPALVGLEQPFGGTMSKVHPESFYMVGVVLAAIGLVAPAGAEVLMLPPQTWKSRAIGDGRAKKPTILSWARRVHGFGGTCAACENGLFLEPKGSKYHGPGCRAQSSAHDEADAIGVCVAVRELVAERRAA